LLATKNVAGNKKRCWQQKTLLATKNKRKGAESPGRKDFDGLCVFLFFNRTQINTDQRRSNKFFSQEKSARICEICVPNFTLWKKCNLGGDLNFGEF